MRHETVLVIVLGLTAGAAAGVGGYTFVYAQGGSYLTDNPQACANCHVMQEYLDGWIRSSHRSVAVCNDCHTPEGFAGKYATKAYNGFWHSFAFTSGRFPDPLQIKPHNRDIVQRSCERCHLDIVQAIDAPHVTQSTLSCTVCHNGVGHSR